MIVRAGYFLFLSCLLAGPVLAEDAGQWLDRMSHSFRELTYSGTLSYQRGEHMQLLRIAHTVIDGKEYERLVYLDGEKREVVRRNHSLKCFYPGQKLARFFTATGSDGQPDPATRVSEHYSIHFDGRGRLAGRDVVNLSIVPRDEFRYGYKLALDEKTGLMIRSELLGAKNKMLERFQFAELEIGGDIAREYFADIDKTSDFKPLDVDKAPRDTADWPAWDVQWVPGGFIPTQPGRDKGQSDMLTYTDGLAVFSVFLESAGAMDDLTVYEGTSTKGATSAYFKILQLAERPHRVTVVGEIPIKAARKIADSVTLAASH